MPALGQGRGFGDEGHPLALQHRHHVLKRVAREVEADGRELVVQLLRADPWIDRPQTRARGVGLISAEQGDLGRGPLGRHRLAIADQDIGLFEQLAPVRVDGVKGAGLGQTLKGPLVDGARIDPLEEIEDVGESPAGFAHLDQMLHGLETHVAYGAKRVQHNTLPAFEGHVEVGRGPVHVRRQHRHVELAGVLIEDRQLVGVGQVQRHRGGEELDRVVRLEPAGLIGNQRIGGGVRLVEAVASELGHQLEDAVRLLFRNIFL